MFLIAAVSVVAAGTTFTCTPVRVWDGDGPIWCAEGPHVRLARIAAREIDGSCRPNQPCPAASGIEARDALVDMLGGSRGTTNDGHVIVEGPRLECLSDGSARGNRTAAWCRLPDGTDLGAALVATGTVLEWSDHPVETTAGRALGFASTVAPSASVVDDQPSPRRRRAGVVSGTATYSSCAAARAAGAAPIMAGSPGYSRRLDRDGDGIACE